jgi:hypothetical protein
LGLEFPVSTDSTNIPGDIQTLADQLDAGIGSVFDGILVFHEAVFASIPAAGVKGRVFRATDTNGIYYDTGSAWFGPLNPASVVTTKGDILVASAAGILQRVGVGADAAVLTARSTATYGLDWESPPAQQSIATLTQHNVAPGNSSTSINVTVPTPGAGTWKLNLSAVCYNPNATVTSGFIDLLHNGSSILEVPTGDVPGMDWTRVPINWEQPGCAAGDTFAVKYSVLSGAAGPVYFVYAGTGPLSGSWFYATWLHA